MSLQASGDLPLPPSLHDPDRERRREFFEQVKDALIVTGRPHRRGRYQVVVRCYGAFGRRRIDVINCMDALSNAVAAAMGIDDSRFVEWDIKGVTSKQERCEVEVYLLTDSRSGERA